VLIEINSQLRRRRRRVISSTTVLAVTLAAFAAHSALLSSASTGDHAIGQAAVTCLAVGGSLALAGVAVFAVRRLRHRLFSPIAGSTAPALPLVPAPSAVAARAGPAPLLQVFRL